MGSTTGISWTDATWNPIRGCSRVSPGCVHCYAETVAASKKMSAPGKPYEGLTDEHGRWNGTIMVVEKHMLDPLGWRTPRKIFVNSMSDLFHENVPDDVIARVFAIMGLRNVHTDAIHTYQVLTKRPERMQAVVSALDPAALVDVALDEALMAWGPVLSSRWDWWKQQARPAVKQMFATWPLPNVWLGVSAEDQQRADERIPLLLQTPAAVRWISAEPLLEGLDLDGYLGKDLAIEEYEDGSYLYGHGLDWVVAGGESGRGYRTMDVGWVDDIAAMCASDGVPLFVKQDSGPKPGKQGRIPDALWSRKEFPR